MDSTLFHTHMYVVLVDDCIYKVFCLFFKQHFSVRKCVHVDYKKDLTVTESH